MKEFTNETYDAIEIRYNEERGEYELWIDDVLNARGEFDGCVEALTMYIESQDDVVPEDSVKKVCDNFIAYNRKRVNRPASTIYFPAASVKYNMDAIEITAGFACDVLSIIRDANEVCFGADSLGRDRAKIRAFNLLNLLINDYSEHIRKMDEEGESDAE